MSWAWLWFSKEDPVYQEQDEILERIKIELEKTVQMTNIKDTLEERGKRYGEFKDNATSSQKLKEVLRDSRYWGGFPPYQREALEMIVHKMGRILHGDHSYPDNWVDIAGYATLVADRLENKDSEPKYSLCNIKEPAATPERKILPVFEQKILAGKMYTAYCKRVGNVAFNGDPLPTWEQFHGDPKKEKQVNGWYDAAMAAFDHFYTKE